jgi:hypothetical protein
LSEKETRSKRTKNYANLFLRPTNCLLPVFVRFAGRFGPILIGVWLCLVLGLVWSCLWVVFDLVLDRNLRALTNFWRFRLEFNRLTQICVIFEFLELEFDHLTQICVIFEILERWFDVILLDYFESFAGWDQKKFFVLYLYVFECQFFKLYDVAFSAFQIFSASKNLEVKNLTKKISKHFYKWKINKKSKPIFSQCKF